MPAKSPKPARLRFVDAAREAGCDEDPAAFERIFAKIVPPKKGGDKVTAPRKAGKKS